MSTTTRLLWLAPDPGTPSRCIVVDAGGQVLADARLDPGAAAPAPSRDAGRCVLVVPGLEVRVAWLDLAARSAAQAAAAARVLLAESTAGADDLHVAVAPGVPLPAATSAPAPWIVAAVERRVLRGWLDRATALGMPADAVVPEQLLLPPAAAPALNVFDVDGRRLVRGERLAFSAEPALAGIVIAGRRCDRVEAPLLYPRALAPDVDLLQAGFAPRARQERGGSRRRVAWLVVALLASPLVLQGTQALRLEVSARQLEARTHALAQLGPAGVPAGGAAVTDPQALHGGTPTEAAAALFAAVAAVPGVRLEALEHRRGDLVRATVAHAQPQDLQALHTLLATDGWRLVEGGSSAATSGTRTTVALERVQ